MAANSDHLPGVGLEETQKATIVVVDPRTLLRGCVVRTLKTEFPELEVVEVVSPQGCSGLKLAAPRLIILGFRAESLCETEIARDLDMLRGSFPDTPIALICDDDEQSLQYAIRFGCSGYVPTSLPLEIAVAALRLVLVGGLYFPQARGHHDSPVTAAMNGHAPIKVPGSVVQVDMRPPNGVAHHEPLVISAPRPVAEALPGFTPREAQVIEALQRGRSNKVIAGDLNLSENTVKVHVRHIMRKLKATNRTQAALRSQVLRGLDQPLN
jgi:DNA-binding NarL/FixJ family response regulator